MKLYGRNVGSRVRASFRRVSGQQMVNSNPSAKCSVATAGPIMDGGANVYKQTNKTERPEMAGHNEKPSHTHKTHRELALKVQPPAPPVSEVLKSVLCARSLRPSFARIKKYKYTPHTYTHTTTHAYTRHIDTGGCVQTVPATGIIHVFTNEPIERVLIPFLHI